MPVLLENREAGGFERGTPPFEVHQCGLALELLYSVKSMLKRLTLAINVTDYCQQLIIMLYY